MERQLCCAHRPGPGRHDAAHRHSAGPSDAIEGDCQRHCHIGPSRACIGLGCRLGPTMRPRPSIRKHARSGLFAIEQVPIDWGASWAQNHDLLPSGTLPQHWPRLTLDWQMCPAGPFFAIAHYFVGGHRSWPSQALQSCFIARAHPAE